MPDIEDLQKIKAALEEQIAQAMAEKAMLKKQEDHQTPGTGVSVVPCSLTLPVGAIPTWAPFTNA